MSTITLPADSLRALLDVYKASLAVHQTLQLSAIEPADEGQEIWDGSLDLESLELDYFELGKAIELAKSKVVGLEAALNTAPSSSMSLALSVQIEGQETDDLQIALEEVLRLVGEEFTEGHNRNETGSYRFLLSSSK